MQWNLKLFYVYISIEQCRFSYTFLLCNTVTVDPWTAKECVRGYSARCKSIFTAFQYWSYSRPDASATSLCTHVDRIRLQIYISCRCLALYIIYDQHLLLTEQCYVGSRVGGATIRIPLNNRNRNRRFLIRRTKSQNPDQIWHSW